MIIKEDLERFSAQFIDWTAVALQSRDFKVRQIILEKVSCVGKRTNKYSLPLAPVNWCEGQAKIFSKILKDLYGPL